MARVTGLEPAASGVTGRRSNQLSYTRIERVMTRARAGWVPERAAGVKRKVRNSVLSFARKDALKARKNPAVENLVLGFVAQIDQHTI